LAAAALVALDAEVIHVVGVTFTELSAPTGDVMNPDTRTIRRVWHFHKMYNVEKVGIYSVAENSFPWRKATEISHALSPYEAFNP